MYTSYWANLKSIVAPLYPVSISCGKPRWIKGGYTGQREDRLAPTREMLKMSGDDYSREYAAILRRLDPHEIYRTLGKNAVLLCWERPGEFCHRRIVAEWLEYHTGEPIPELGFDRLDSAPQTQPNFDHYEEHPQRIIRLKRLLNIA